MSFKKDDIAALYVILPDMVHGEDELHEGKSLHTALKFNFQIFNPNQIAKGNKNTFSTESRMFIKETTFLPKLEFNIKAVTT